MSPSKCFFASNFFFGTVLDPVDQGGLLLQLLDGLVALNLCILKCTGFRYEYSSVPGYELLFLLHHLLGLRTALRQVDLRNLIHGLFGTGVLLTAQRSETLSTCESRGSFLRCYLQVALKLSVSDMQVDHTGYG